MTVFLLVSCVALVALTTWFRRHPSVRSNAICVHARQTIDARRAILIVEVAGRGLVVGSSDTGLHTLAELNAAELARVTANVSRETSEAE